MSDAVERARVLLEQLSERVGADAILVQGIVAETFAYPYEELSELLEELAVTRAGETSDYSVLGEWGMPLGLNPYRITPAIYLTALLTKKAEIAERTIEWQRQTWARKAEQVWEAVRKVAADHGCKLVHVPETLPDGRQIMRFDTVRLVPASPTQTDKDPTP